MRIPDPHTCLLRNMYAGQEATVKTGHGKMDWFQIGKGVRQGCILSPCLFNICRAHFFFFLAEHILRNARLDEAQAGIKIARRNSNNLRYADDTTIMAESKEELKSLLMNALFLGSEITTDSDCSYEVKRQFLLGRKAMTNLDSILKGKDITLPTKIHIVKAMAFPVVMYGCES